MNNNNNSNAGAGIGFTGFLALIFIVLKLIGVINWPWLWVLSPIWIPLVILILPLIILPLIVLIKNKIKSEDKDEND